MKTKIVILMVLACAVVKAQVFSRLDGTAYHVHAGTAVSGLSGGLIYHYTKKPAVSIAGGFGVALLVGGGKELIYDLALGRGVPSWDDFWSTAWGAAVGGLCVSVGINIHRTKRIERYLYRNDAYARD